MAAAPDSGCPLCREDGGLLIARHDSFRIIRATGADAADCPGFYRVAWNDHVAEFSDLSEADQLLCLRAVSAVERVLREQLAPTKVNLAALGNMVPHLHWHVIARFDWDARWPAPVWAAPQRASDDARLAALRERLPGCDAAIAALPF
jgi:diadenosine tetraphosphate (Ap4A) HIT family hydrolase